MHILRRLPFAARASRFEVAGETVEVRPYQIVLRVSVSPAETLPAGAPSFPAVLDTGHNHNFSIQRGQLERWAGLRLDELPTLGDIRVNQQLVPLMAIRVWLHRNRPGTADWLSRPVPLSLPQGIAVYPDAMPAAPRLPLLGLRGLVTTNLRLIMDGRLRGGFLATRPSRRVNAWGGKGTFMIFDNHECPFSPSLESSFEAVERAASASERSSEIRSLALAARKF